MKNKLSNQKSPTLLVVGSVAYDTIITPFGKAPRTLGGSASYFSLASSYFTPTDIVAVVGKDFKDLSALARRNIGTAGIQKQEGKTFHWAGKYHFDLNTRETLKTELGVFARFKPKLTESQKKSAYLFLGNIHPALQLEVLNQMRKPKLVGLDTMNFWIDSALEDLKKVLKRVNVFVINDSEARQISKEHNIYKAAGKILKMMGGKNNTLVIKRGEYGLLMFNNGQIFHLPGLPLEDVIDPTGAGDSFAGGMFGYLAGRDNPSADVLKKACVYGTAMASFCVQDFGTKPLQNLKLPQIRQRAKLLHKLIKM